MIDWNRWQQYQQAMTPWQWGLVALAVFASIWLIVWLRSYFREDADSADEALEMLSQFRELHQEGGLSDDEFRLIRSRLARNAHEALQAGSDKQNTVPMESGSPIPAGLGQNISENLPADHAKEEDKTSSGTMDEETE